MITTYHNHSTWSDGKASIREMALAARAAGVREFGISDHFVFGPPEVWEDAKNWGMPVEQLEAYFEEASSVKAEVDCDDFHFRIGVEADYFDETWEEIARRLSALPLDYVIGAVHYAGAFPIDASAKLWEPKSLTEREGIWREYFRKLKLCSERLPCNFLAHPDLPKIFNMGGRPADFREDFKTLLKGCAERGIAIEINTAGLDKLCGEVYPSLDLLSDAVELGIGILVDGDAHCPQQITRHFEDAYAMLKSLGVNRTCGFTGGKLHWNDI